MAYEDLEEIFSSDFSLTIRSMDDRSFALFVKRSFGEHSTPKKISVRSSVSHDPFDDSLDNVLMKMEYLKNGNLDTGDETDDDSALPQVAIAEAGLSPVSSEKVASNVPAVSSPVRVKKGLQRVQILSSDINFDFDSDSQNEKTSKNLINNHSVVVSDSVGDGSLSRPASQVDKPTTQNFEEVVNENTEADTSVGKPHEFGDYGTYFENKKKKQQVADEMYIEWERKRKQNDPLPEPIFRGCEIHVNGHTVPSINEIHRLVILHGGKFVSYLNNKSAATHIVCDRLTPRKRIQFKNYKVVKAQWIVDSIEKGELLNWGEYRLIDNVDYGQQRLPLSGTSGGTEMAEIVDTDLLKEADNCTELNIDEDEEQDFDEIVLLIRSQEEIDQDFNLTPSGEAHLDSLNETNKKKGVILDSKHPDFLKHFFAYSRLHHLSSWKADLRAHFLEKILQLSNSQEKKKAEPRPPSKRVIIHADFDCFFVTASVQNRPDLDIEAVPIAVSHGGRTSDVSSCNYVARTAGVKNGMWLGQAKRLCPELITIGYDFELYERHSNTLYTYLIECGFFDSIFPVLVDEVLLDVSSHIQEEVRNDTSLSIEAAVYLLSLKIRKDVLELTKCTISIGASHNVLLAKLSLRKAKPNGQFYLPNNSSTVEDFLSDIPVRNLPGIGGSIVQRLVEEIRQSTGKDIEVPLIVHLRTLSESKLKTAFGEKTGAKLYQCLRGIDDTSIDIKDGIKSMKRKSVSVDVNYGIRFDNISQLDTFLMELSKELHRRLMHISMCGRSLTLKLARRALTAPVDPEKFLGMGRCTFSSKSSKLGLHTSDWGIIGSELKALYRMLNVPIHDLRGIAITMATLERVDFLKSSRQKKLPFKLGAKADFKWDIKANKPELTMPVKSICDVKVEEQPIQAHAEFEPLDIDWEVFEELPPSIKQELQVEIQRRGLQVKGDSPRKSPSPSKLSPTKMSPSKNTKAYIQQHIPVNGEFEYSRVIGSPKKTSPRKRVKVLTSANTLPQKKSRINDVYVESSSYDESVIDELPYEIRQEVLRDLQIKKGIDRLRHKEKPQSVQINSNWLYQQKKALSNTPPLFQKKLITLPDLKSLFIDWICSSLLQGGPHMDDIHVVQDHLEELLKQDDLLRSTLLLNFIKMRVECEKVNFSSRQLQNVDIKLVSEGLEEWSKLIIADLGPVIMRYCIDKNIILEQA